MYAHVVYQIGDHVGSDQIACTVDSTEEEIKHALREILVRRHGSLPKNFSYFELLRKTESHI